MNPTDLNKILYLLDGFNQLGKFLEFFVVELK